MMRPVLAIAVLCALPGCANLDRTRNFETRESDYGAIAYQSLKYIEMRGPVQRFAVAPDVDPRIRNALKSERPVSPDPLRRDGPVPPGEFVLTKFEIADGEAVFEGTLGTLRGESPCDLHFTIPWYLQKNNDWWNPSYKIESCDRREESDE